MHSSRKKEAGVDEINVRVVKFGDPLGLSWKLPDLHAGPAEDEFLTCDLTQEYVRINAEYST